MGILNSTASPFSQQLSQWSFRAERRDEQPFKYSFPRPILVLCFLLGGLRQSWKSVPELLLELKELSEVKGLGRDWW